ncbi:MAG: DeoR/GlpR transcriptional regulator [Chitinophagaceae bacterium]|nr:MAG: DeoR/GlpR transcriptional regulator [Chitinophagaceae bacterium]
MEDVKRSTVSRRVHILELLNRNGQVDVGSLSRELNVSEVTIRNDLTRLEQKNLLIKARGGALKVERVATDFSIRDKNRQHQEEKQRIGKAAAALIEAGETIILDSGTTTMEVARHLDNNHPLTVITNALNIAEQLSEHLNLNVMVPGGVLRKNSLSLVGSTAETGFRSYFCDKLFLAVDGFNIEHGLSTPNVEEAHLNRIMIEISRQVVVVADSSKFHKRSFAFIAPINKVDVLVTDSGILPEDQKKLETLGIRVIVA